MTASRLLLVEDEQIVALDLRLNLEALGYTVVGLADSAAVAVDLAGELRPDAVIMDIILKGGSDGITAAAEIRRRFLIPVIYLTSCADRDTLVRARVTEPFGFVHKPVDPHELQATIEMALYKHSISRKLLENEQWLSATMNSLDDGVMAARSDGQIVLFNPAAERLTGWKTAAAIGRRLSEVCHLRDEGLGQFSPNVVERLCEESERGAVSDFILLTRLGGSLPVEARACRITDCRDEKQGVLLVFRDITERRLAGERLRRSEERLRGILESQRDLVVRVDVQGRFTFVNQAYCRTFGRSEVELLGKTFQPLVHPDDLAATLKAMENLEIPPYHAYIEQRAMTVDGWRWIAWEDYAIKDADKQTVEIQAVGRDITAARRAEQSLRESELRYRRFVESVTDYIYTVTFAGGKIVSTCHSPACLAVTGYTAAEYESDPDLWIKMVHEQDRQQVQALADRMSAGEVGMALEHRIIHKSGEIRWIRNTYVPRRDETGLLAECAGLVSDITARKLAELQLQEHVRRLEIINEVIAAANRAENFDDLPAEILNLLTSKMGFAGGAVLLAEPTGEAVRTIGTLNLPAEWLAGVEAGAGKAGPARLAALFRNGEAVFPADAQEVAAWFPEAARWNIRAALAVPMMSRDAVIGALVLTAGAPRICSGVEQEMLLAIGRQLGTAAAKMRSEAARRESEEQYRTISEQALVGIQIVRGRRLLFVNEAWSAIFGYTREEAIAWTPETYARMIHPADCDFVLGQLDQKESGAGSGDLPVYDCRLFSKVGELKWVMMHARAVEFSGARAVVCMLVDVTDRKIAEQALAAANRRLRAREEQLQSANQQLFAANEQLQASQQELMAANRDKEVMLKEIHHRVKNNLQVVSSLLKLQLAQVTDRKAVQALQECRNRIRSIAMVHEKVYQSPNLADVNVGDYVRELLDHLLRMYPIAPDLIRAEVAVGDAALTINKAIPCSLIINELVSNSLKYAFPEGRAGRIFVRFGSENGRLVLTVGDDGVGFPEKLDFRNTRSLGLQLVNTFVSQLNGEISREPGPGTTFVIRFANDPEAGSRPAARAGRG